MFKCEKCGHEGYAHPERARALGFNSGSLIAAGAAAIITTRPQLKFRGTRLFIPADVAKNFQIKDIRVGYNSQFSSSEPLPGPSFSQVAEDGIEGRLFDFDLAQVGADISIVIQNIQGQSHHPFSASLHGFDCE